MQHSFLVSIAWLITDCGRNHHLICFWVHDHTPDTIQEIPDAADPGHCPRLGCLQGPHEHFIQSQGIGAVLTYNLVRINDVATTLRHLERTTINSDGRIVFQDKTLTFLFDLFLGQRLGGDNIAIWPHPITVSISFHLVT